ncbi:uncharacterized protein LOC128396936 [Panonychus citri]|uniref:uncharacterized protein LOC128396936 n=1 Tax=Panonychus citri TaxID=50023 RepID=UPI002307A34F|nr:uncharacterized protein LOC128396936 [Panonychus citri]
MSGTLSVISLLCLCSIFSQVQSNKVNYCYDCRSRVSGDCRDPFIGNETTIIDLIGIRLVPCPSGWCSKSLEGKEGDTIITTERKCLPRPPIDSVERCSRIFYENKREPLYMCSCRGHLCNHGSIQLMNLPVISVIPILSILINQFLISN